MKSFLEVGAPLRRHADVHFCRLLNQDTPHVQAHWINPRQRRGLIGPALGTIHGDCRNCNQNYPSRIRSCNAVNQVVLAVSSHQKVRPGGAFREGGDIALLLVPCLHTPVKHLELSASER